MNKVRFPCDNGATRQIHMVLKTGPPFQLYTHIILSSSSGLRSEIIRKALIEQLKETENALRSSKALLEQALAEDKDLESATKGLTDANVNFKDQIKHANMHLPKPKAKAKSNAATTTVWVCYHTEGQCDLYIYILKVYVVIIIYIFFIYNSNFIFIVQTLYSERCQIIGLCWICATVQGVRIR